MFSKWHLNSKLNCLIRSLELIEIMLLNHPVTVPINNEIVDHLIKGWLLFTDIYDYTWGCLDSLIV